MVEKGNYKCNHDSMIPVQMMNTLDSHVLLWFYKGFYEESLRALENVEPMKVSEKEQTTLTSSTISNTLH